MAELIFIEGVSGVGKSTMVQALAQELRQAGRRVEAYVEFDARNPIDFYCTAYLTAAEYARLCGTYPAEDIPRHAVRAGAAYLVRYYDEDTPLFDEPLLRELARRELCYKPQTPVSMARYCAALQAVWRDFAAGLGEEWEYILFDGSLLHHPLNDMMRNYDPPAEAMAAHVCALLDALDGVKRWVYYLRTQDIASQLAAAHVSRGQPPPTAEYAAFWQRRYENDMRVLESVGEAHRVFDVTGDGWDAARREILAGMIG